MTPDSQIQQRLTYTIEYPVIFTENVFDPSNPLLARTLDRLNENRVHRAMVFVDSNVADLFPQITQHIIQYFEAYANDIELAEAPRTIPGGEIVKSDFSVVPPMTSALIEAHLCRHSYVIIVGGGAVLDTVGFAASVTHRGLRVVKIPTTVLSQASAGVGIKTGVNFANTKDGMGTFAAPFAVINDSQFLFSLQDRDWIAGVAEGFKTAIAADAEFFEDLVSLASTIPQRQPETITGIVRKAASLNLQHTSTQNDPGNSDFGHPLDVGHWAARKIESMSCMEISYGEALAMGILIDCRYGTEMGWLSEPDFERIHMAFTQAGFPLWFSELDVVGADGNLELLQGIPEFQEHMGGVLTIVYPDGIGATRMEHEVDLEALDRALARLKTAASAVVELQR
jgi:3-dehydroquinate synthase